MMHISCICCLMWCPGIVVLTPLWIYIHQCHEGKNTVRVRWEKLTMLGHPQDKDGEDDISIQMKSGFCTQSARKLGRHESTENQYKFTEQCQERFPRLMAHAFLDYPMEIRIVEDDWWANDYAKPMVLTSEKIKALHALLQKDGESVDEYRAIHIQHIFWVSEQHVPEKLKNTLNSDSLCISAMDALPWSKVGGKAGSKAGAKQAGEQMGEALGSTLQDITNLEVCALDMVDFLSNSFTDSRSAVYLAQFVVEDARFAPPDDLPVLVPEMECNETWLNDGPSSGSPHPWGSTLCSLLSVCAVWLQVVW